MRTPLNPLFALVVLSVAACEEPVAPPEDARPTFDVPVTPTDRLAVTDTPVSTSDIVDERGSVCRAGAFRPCECMPGVGGRDYCVNMAYEGLCRCGDAAPPSTDATSDARSDAPGDGAPVDGSKSDAAVSDAADEATVSSDAAQD